MLVTSLRHEDAPYSPGPSCPDFERRSHHCATVEESFGASCTSPRNLLVIALVSGVRRRQGQGWIAPYSLKRVMIPPHSSDLRNQQGWQQRRGAAPVMFPDLYPSSAVSTSVMKSVLISSGPSTKILEPGKGTSSHLMAARQSMHAAHSATTPVSSPRRN